MKPSPRMLHSSPVEEKKLGCPFSENGPSSIQVEGATASFSDLREWEERGVTTPIICGGLDLGVLSESTCDGLEGGM